MTEDDSNMLSTSFLDVITCGLGSILLLFFLMASLKGEMQFDAGTEAEGIQSDRAAVPPFIVLVTGTTSDPIWAPGVTSPWQAPETNFDYKEVVGQDHAILYALGPPPPGWTLKVGPFAANARIRVQVVAEGRRLPIGDDKEMKTMHEGDSLSLWPLPEGALP